MQVRDVHLPGLAVFSVAHLHNFCDFLNIMESLQPTDQVGHCPDL